MSGFQEYKISSTYLKKTKAKAQNKKDNFQKKDLRIL